MNICQKVKQIIKISKKIYKFKYTFPYEFPELVDFQDGTHFGYEKYLRQLKFGSAVNVRGLN